MKYKFFNIFCIFLFITSAHFSLSGQIVFNDVYGKKANYKISIPSNYIKSDAIGANVDLKYVNNQGFSIVTVIKKAPTGTKPNDIKFILQSTDYEIKKGLEATGLSNLTILNKGLTEIDGHPSAFVYYTDGELYFHGITLFRNGKVINLTITCTFRERNSNLAYIYRVVNSLVWLDE
jgi:hypothetical protein